jgi:hypothetical protein
LLLVVKWEAVKVEEVGRTARAFDVEGDGGGWLDACMPDRSHLLRALHRETPGSTEHELTTEVM